jgi:hypothetical protein
MELNQNIFENDSSLIDPAGGLSPRVFIDDINMRYGPLFIVREDLLPGGSKQRACAPLLQALVDRGHSHFIYASPFCGFAQVALAYVCRELGLSCQIFAERAPTADNIEFKHTFTQLAESYGAKVFMVNSLEEAEIFAGESARRVPRSFKIPLGFNCVEFRDAYEREIRAQWATICSLFDGPPRRLWLPVGSGTLASIFSRVVDDRTSLQCVNVRVLPDEDDRLARLRSDPRVQFFSAPEHFHEAARVSPALPSNAHYDAKLWQFLVEHGEAGDLWWNVAR